MGKKVLAIYSIIVGISIFSMWSMIILTGGISEGTIEISFHLTSEFLMAILLVISGIGLLKNKLYGNKLSLLANSMLIYSVLNAAGYYRQRGNFPMEMVFAVILVISSLFMALEIFKEKGGNR
jgi:uncharacterized membrane protein (DUF2068 family)